MNTMPGFTAEASLSEAARDYPAVATDIATETQVVPQYGICDKAAYYCARGYQQWCDIEDRFCDIED